MIVLVGTSHVSQQSAREVAEAITTADLVAVELDHGRAHALLSGERASFTELRRALGLRTAALASVLRFAQERIAAAVGVVPGLEMKEALVAAAKQGKRVALIDRDVRVTLGRLRKALGWREFWRFCKDLFRPRKVSLHPSDEMVLELLSELKTSYPRIYQVMVSERDEHMARALLRVQAHHPEARIVAVVGKGHVPGMLNRIKHLNAAAEATVWSSSAKR